LITASRGREGGDGVSDGAKLTDFIKARLPVCIWRRRDVRVVQRGRERKKRKEEGESKSTTPLRLNLSTLALVLPRFMKRGRRKREKRRKKWRVQAE